VEQYYEERKQHTEKPQSLGPINSFVVAFKSFLGNNSALKGVLNINEISFWDKFELYLRKQKEKTLKDTTSSKYIAWCRTFYRWLVIRELVEKKDSVLDKKFKHKIIKKDNTLPLEIDELKKLKELTLDKSSDYVRDAFLFQCLTSVRFSDLPTDDRDINFKEKTFKTISKKTSEPLEIQINDTAINILKKHNCNLHKLQYSRFNVLLKKIFKDNKIFSEDPTYTYTYSKGGTVLEDLRNKNEFITSKSGRQTFVRIGIQKGMPMDIIMQHTGHKSLEMVSEYFKIYGTKKDYRNMIDI
jgi:site-specific recombinase XerD